MAQILGPGIAAPEFTLHVTPDQKLSLSDCGGGRSFWRFIRRTGVRCAGTRWRFTTKFCRSFRSIGAELRHFGGWGLVSRGVCEGPHLHFPLLADFEPKGEVAGNMGRIGTRRDCERALFVIDMKGKLAGAICSPVAVNPGADGILRRWKICRNKRRRHGRVENSGHGRAIIFRAMKMLR